jgi:hypothetical protein
MGLPALAEARARPRGRGRGQGARTPGRSWLVPGVLCVADNTRGQVAGGAVAAAFERVAESDIRVATLKY